MSKLHVLRGTQSLDYTIVVHGPTPAGNNSAGVAWSACLVAAGLAQTQMTIGSGPGQISQAEADGIAAGTTMEAVFSFTDEPALTTPQRNALLDAQATQLLQGLQDRYALELKWFGAVRN